MLRMTCTLLRISPSGAVTSISQLYPGFISDKEIVAHSGDSVMDDGFYHSRCTKGIRS